MKKEIKIPLDEPLEGLSAENPFQVNFSWPNDGSPPFYLKLKFNEQTGTTRADVYVFDRKFMPIIPHHYSDETSNIVFITEDNRNTEDID